MEIKNIHEPQSIEQIRLLIDEIKICMCCVKGQHYNYNNRPVGVSRMDEEGNIWLLGSKSSYATTPIISGEQLELIYSEPGQSHSLTIYGIGILVRSLNKVQELWTSTSGEWFKQGLDDPDISLLKVIPTEAYYWDTKLEHVVALLERAKAA